MNPCVGHIGTQCWRAMEDRRHNEARMEYIERDSKALGRTAA